MKRIAEVERKTKETKINIKLNINGKDKHKISSGIPFFDHMLSLFAVHGFFDVSIFAKGDIEVDFHHTVEDVGLVLGEAFNKALSDRIGIKRYGHAVTPMDDALTFVTIDLSNRPFLVYNIPDITNVKAGSFDVYLAKEFFRAFANKSGLNLHINVFYGENEHHIIESIFKSFGRALDQATSFDERITSVRSTKGSL
ncbi:MAG: imidazoleglycerol-phosphate dehydratase HisB [Thermodesulfobacteriota bacterium]|nr:imidazoleglycerol-phosphate dehydratase HisB [Thermodesulfobacteriota bacterium]